MKNWYIFLWIKFFQVGPRWLLNYLKVSIPGYMISHLLYFMIYYTLQAYKTGVRCQVSGVSYQVLFCRFVENGLKVKQIREKWTRTETPPHCGFNPSKCFFLKFPNVFFFSLLFYCSLICDTGCVFDSCLPQEFLLEQVLNQHHQWTGWS